MKEIKLGIPDGCKAVTVKVDGENVITEFELQEGGYKPQDGDIIAYRFNRANLNIGIFHECVPDPEGNSLHEDYVTIGGDSGKLIFGEETFIHDYLRPATEAEKQRLFDALAKAGKRWNTEEKRVEDLPRWRADHGETYYYIESDLQVEEDTDDGIESDNACHSAGNYFRTCEAAERVAKQIREIFKNSKAE